MSKLTQDEITQHLQDAGVGSDRYIPWDMPTMNELFKNFQPPAKWSVDNIPVYRASLWEETRHLADADVVASSIHTQAMPTMSGLVENPSDLAKVLAEISNSAAADADEGPSMFEQLRESEKDQNNQANQTNDQERV